MTIQRDKALDDFIESGALATNMCPNFLRDAYFKAGYDSRDKEVEELRKVLEMVLDNTKMPHQHTDPQLRLYCLSERANEVLNKVEKDND